ncbi:MAG TPA: hypothetical protein VJH67_02635 [Candidatus Paceibacterota bacterium]
MKNKTKIGVLVLIIIGIYGLWSGRNLLTGPTIEIIEPSSGATLNQNPIKVAGIVDNASFITLNDYPIFSNEEGIFSEEILAYPGYNVLVLEVKDRFGESVSKKIEFYYNGPFPEWIENNDKVSTSTETELE